MRLNREAKMELLIDGLGKPSEKDWSIELLDAYPHEVDLDSINEESVISNIAYFDVETEGGRVSIKNKVTIEIKRNSTVRSALFEFGNKGALLLASAGEGHCDLNFSSSILIEGSTVTIDSLSVSLPSC